MGERHMKKCSMSLYDQRNVNQDNKMLFHPREWVISKRIRNASNNKNHSLQQAFTKYFII